MDTIKQATLFGDVELAGIVNVASVPQRSPFRYPGGKTWLVPRIRQWLAHLRQRPTEFVEPFAGGGIVSLTVAAEKLADHVTMVELDEDVAAVWQAVLDAYGEALADKIAGFQFTEEAVSCTLTQASCTPTEKAFRTILKNRVNRGGIRAPGAGLVKRGENGKGLASRWYPQTLQRRILAIVAMTHRISFIKGDGLEVLRSYSERVDVAFFIDPPYTAAGKKAGSRLYTHFSLNHDELFRVATMLAGDFLMTYDDTPEVRQLAEFYGLEILPVPMKNTHHARICELLIGRDLSWAR